jgi:hypothetical protein
VPGWLLEETATHIITATVPGAETRQLVGGRHEIIQNVAAGTERTEVKPWHTNRVVWLTPFRAAHAVGHFWNDASGQFIGYYINLQAPVRRSAYGVDSKDHILDIVVDPDGQWRWKDEDELELAVRLGMFSEAESVEIRTEGERVINQFRQVLPTGWENWVPDPTWDVETLKLSAQLQREAASGGCTINC